MNFEPTPRRPAGKRWITQGLPVALVLIGTLLGATIGFGQYPLLLVVLALAFALLALFTPRAFFGLSMLVYSLIQVGLVRIDILRIGGLSINASQLYILCLLSLAGLGVMGQAAIGKIRLPPMLNSVRLQLALICWLAIALVYSEQFQLAAASVARHTADVAGFYLAYTLAAGSSRTGWIKIGVGGAALVAAVSTLVESVAGGILGPSARVLRVAGTFGGPVQTGTICLAGLAFFVSLLPGLRGRARLFCVAAVVVSGLGMFATLTRTAILGAILFTCALVWSRSSDRRSRMRFLSYAVITIGTIAVAIYMTPQETLQSRTADIPFLGEHDVTSARVGSGRGQIWNATIEALGENGPVDWIIGNGINSVSLNIRNKIPISVGAHNSYLQLLYDAGIVGLLLYLAAIFSIVRDLAARRPGGGELESVRIWSAYMIAYFLSTELFNHYLYALGPRFVTWIVLGLYMAQVHTRDRH